MSTYSWRISLQISGSIPDHHHSLEAVLLLQHVDHFSFSTALSCGLSLIETSILT